MSDASRIRLGMTVEGADGEEVGKVVALDASTFVVERGVLSPRRHVARYDDVTGVDGERIHLSRRRDELGDAGIGPREGTYAEASGTMGPGGGFETAPVAIGLEGDLGGGERRLVSEGGEQAGPPRQAGADEGPIAQFGEDPGVVGPTRGEPED